MGWFTDHHPKGLAKGSVKGRSVMKLFIDTDWYDMIQDLPKDKQIEIMYAVFAFPNGDSNTHVWKKIIKPQLEQSAKLYVEKAQRFAENRKKRWQQKSEQISDNKSEQISNRYQNVNVNVNDINNNSRNNNNNLSTTHVNPTEQEVLDYAKQQDDMAGVGGFAVSQEQAQAFYDYYSGIGWVLPNDAKTPIVDWKPFLRKWAKNPRFKNRESDTVDINDPDHFLI
jgi:hypothetical protein